jgi:hypothetical protein
VLFALLGCLTGDEYVLGDAMQPAGKPSEEKRGTQGSHDLCHHKRRHVRRSNSCKRV